MEDLYYVLDFVYAASIGSKHADAFNNLLSLSFRCPVVLSSFTNWTECTYKDPNSQTAGGCYKIRDLPTTNQLIYIDTTEFVVDCECPDQIV